MSSETLQAGEPVRQGIDLDFIGDGIAGLERTLRPTEGWIAGILMVVNLVVVVLSVEQADWVATPNLVVLLFFAMVTWLLLYRIPLWSIALIPVGLAVGLAVMSPLVSSSSLQFELHRDDRAFQLYQPLHEAPAVSQHRQHSPDAFSHIVGGTEHVMCEHGYPHGTI